MNKSSELITKELIDMYNIIETDEETEIHEPAFIKIDKDHKYNMNSDSVVIKIENSKIIVNLWIKTKYMHVTVL